jgi:FMN-dependent oxidoreductase (nitrilotriacetate monooxygenase family)
MSNRRQEIVLNAFTMNTVAHLSPGVWRHPRDQARRYVDLAYWTKLAQTLERGLLDAVFIADVLGVYDVYGASNDAALSGALQLPVNDPLQLVPAMAAVTENLGFGITASVSFEHPYPFARRMSTLDHLTRGRAGWNVVTSYLNSGALNMGMDAQEAHDRRYDIADEYLEVCYKLWERSWEADAVTADGAAGVYADPDKVHPIGHVGEFFKVPGIHLAEPSPQRTPVIYQAGASPRGLRFAAKHAESLFVASPTKGVLRPQVPRIREAIEAAGRDPRSVSVLNQHTVIVAETDAEAHRLYAEYGHYASADGALALMSGWMGIDLADFDPDAPLEEQPSDAIQSTVKAFSSADPGKRWTIRELGEYSKIGGDGPVSVGSPQTVADELEGWVEETGIDGFNLAAAAVPETFEAVVDLLVPELQRRGRFKRGYAPGTLREKLTGSGPGLPAEHPATQVAISAPAGA